MPSETRRIKYLYCVIAHPLSNGGWQVRFTRNSKLDCTKHPNQNTFHDELYFLATTYNYGTNDTSPIMKKAAFSIIRWHFFQFESMIRLFLKCQRFETCNSHFYFLIQFPLLLQVYHLIRSSRRTP